MIIEHGLLHIRPGEAAAFEVALQAALPYITASPGFLGLEVRPAAEQADLYLLLVRWRSVADHRDGFRQSERYQQWRAALHHFYDPMPQISYFAEPVVQALC